MKHLYKFITFLTFILLFIVQNNEVKATHAMGADLTYTCVGSNQYRIRYSFYRDCGGITPNSTYTLNYSSASCSRSGTLTLTLLAGYPVEVSPLCPAQMINSTCNGGSQPGIQQWIYEGTVTLPQACTDWVFGLGVSARNTAINTISSPGSQDLYVEARMNNVAFPCNNSPTFSTLPVPYVCMGQPLSYNHGATDIDGDSLFYELVPCLHNATTPVPYLAGYSATSPFSSSTAITINSANGTVSATPSAIQVGIFAVKVSEYRGGVLIGSVIRDIQITVITCTNVVPALSNYLGMTGGVLTTPTLITACAGVPLSFMIRGSDADAGDSLSMINNILSVLPGATMTLRGSNPDTAFISWTPPSVGFYSFVITLRDNHCPIYGQTVLAYDIMVSGVRVTTGDTAYRCAGSSTTLLAAGSTTGYTWSVISGDASSLSCTTCNPTTVSPTSTTRYRVVGTAPAGCPSSDTITVIYVPPFTISSNRDTTICSGYALNLNTTSTYSGTTTYLWTPSTGLSNANIANPVATPTVTTTYVVRGAAGSCYSYDTVVVTVSGVMPVLSTIITPTPYCNGDTLNLITTLPAPNCNVYNVNSISYSPLTTSGTNVTLGNNVVSSALPIGFSFKFFCNTYTNFYISSNGFITFSSGSSSAPTAQLIPSVTAPDNLIALYWEDLNTGTGSGNVNYYTTGTSPNRKLVVNFNNVRHQSSSITVTAQLILFEGSNNIELHYTSANTDGGDHTMGIENLGGTIAYSTAGRNFASWSLSSTAFRFSPDTLPAYVYTWTPTSGLFPRTDTATAKHVVSGSRSYSINVNNAGCVNNATFNIVSGSNTGAISATICSNQVYLFNGINRNTSGTYRDTFTNIVGCDSVVTLTLTVKSTSARTITQTLCAGSSYLFNGIYRTSSGTYLDTFTNSVGCDSIVTLSLTVRAPSTGVLNIVRCSNQFYLFNGVNRNTTGTYLDTFVNVYGCDSVVTLNLTIRPTSTGTINATICSNQVYVFNGINRNTSGSYLDTFTNSNGCDSVVTLNLTVRPTSTGTINATICSNQVYAFNGVNRNVTGTYLDTFSNATGCDSVVTLNLTVRPTSTGTINATICSNQVYAFNGVNRNTSGSYLDTFSNYTGCDSVVTLNLTVRPISTHTINATICSNQVYVFNGINRNVTGTYLDTFTNYTGCDSVVTLNLTVRPTSTGTINATICSNQVYAFNGVNRNVTGSYLDTFANSIGCDSVVTLNLTVLSILTATIDATICSNESYLFNGVNRNTTGSYLDTFISISGCDSVVTLNLTVHATSTGNINTTICSNQTYLFNGLYLHTTGTYLDTFANATGCDSVVTLHLIVNPTSTGTINATICSNQTYLFNGVNLNVTGSYLDTFANATGCDSVVTLNLTVRPTSTGTINATICSNQFYLFNGVNRNITGAYLDTFANSTGCDSVVTLNLTVLSVLTTTIDATICSNESYLFNGIYRNVSGSYLDSFVSISGCDSVVTLSLTVRPTSTHTIIAHICSNQVYPFNGVNLNITGTYLDTFTNGTGCDSVVTLNLTVRPTSTGTINATICSNQFYLFNGVNLNVTGSYLDTFANATGCDSVVTLNLTVRPTSTGTINATICSNQFYLFNGVNRNITGAYLDTFANSTGCDSVVTLNLTVLSVLTTTIDATICSNESYLFNGIYRNVSGSYLDSFVSISGCDSVVTLSLTVRPTSTHTIIAHICSNQVYPFNGVNLNITGTYLDTFTNGTGCDSVVTLNLTVRPTSTGTINATICSNQTYLFNGVNLNVTGSYLDTFANATGCDSVVTLNLNVRPTSTGTINATICSNQFYLFNGVNRNITGAYLDTFANSTGCDSVVTLNLTVLTVLTTSINATICSNGTYLFNGIYRNVSGSYLDSFVSISGCDSVVTLHLIVNPTSTGTINATICSNQVYPFNGVNLNITGAYLDTFANSTGCDSVVTLNLTVRPTSTGTINGTICSNQVYLFNGVNRNVTGSYLDTFANATGCDSVVTLNLTVLPTSTGTINATICSNQVYLFNGINRNITGAYLDTFANSTGCDSVVTLNLTVRPTTTSTINATICSNETYLFNGVYRNITGTYKDTFTNYTGCDSVVTLRLTVHATSIGTINATICSNQVYPFNGVNLNITGAYLDTFTNATGCDSVVTLHLIVNPTSTGTINATICSNQVYLFNGVNRNTSGTYLDTFANSTGCDSVVTLNLTVRPTSTGTINATICANQFYTFNGINRNVTGAYLDTFANSTGCDSVVTLNLTVRPTSTRTINATICANETYLFNGVYRNITGTYKDTFTNYTGCDSVVTLRLTVHATSIGTINTTICSNQTYLFNGVNLNVTGTYLDTFANATGCDSVVTLHLIVNTTSTGTINATICSNQVYTFNGVNRNVTGSYLDTFANATGCDSVVTLNLTVRPTSTGIINATICANQFYSFNGINRNVTGAYLDTFANATGCDSVVTLNLTVRPTSTRTINATICANETYLFNGVYRNITGTYKDTFTNYTGCDSVVTLRLTVHATSTGTINTTICSNETYLFNGVYLRTTGTFIDTFANATGCDSVVTLHLIVNPIATTTIRPIICSGSSIAVGSSTYTVSGTYYDTLTSHIGCDSIVTTILIVHPIALTSQSFTICSNFSISVGSSTYSATGTYYDTLSTYLGCDSIITTVLTVNPIRKVVINPVICEGSTYTVGSSVYSTSGTYRDTLTTYLGCDSIVTTNLTVVPSIYISLSITICEGTSIKIGSHTYTIAGDYADTITSTGGCDSVVFTSLIISPKKYTTQNIRICLGDFYSINGKNYNTDGTFIDTIIASTGCDSIVTTNLTVYKPSYLTIDTTICHGNFYKGIRYFSTTTYNDTINASFGCDSLIIINNINVLPERPLLATDNILICNGSSATISVTGGYSGVYTWSPSSLLSCDICATTTTVSLTESTVFTVSTKDCNDSILTLSVMVHVKDKPEIQIINEDTCVYMGQKITLSVANINDNQISWNQDNQILCEDCHDYTFQPMIPGIYTATVTDEMGCQAIDSVNLCVRTDCPTTSLIIPNFITPNGDGANDKFRFLNPENLPIVFLRIFDRWGELIFESYSSSPEWDGTYLGKACMPGVYAYYLEGNCPFSGNFIKKGNVTILK